MGAPALSIDGGEDIGRLYYSAGTVLDKIEREPLIASKKAIKESVRSGHLVPSITNIIDAKNLPFLKQWYADMTARLAVDVESKYPGRITAEPKKAYEYLRYAAVRDVNSAAFQGTVVHDAAETIGRGGEIDESKITPVQSNYIDSWKAWVDKWQPEFLAHEVTCFGVTPSGEGYAGTSDIIFRLGDKIIVADYKTTRSGLHDEVALQLCAAANATYMTHDSENLVPMLKIDAAVGIHLSADGYQVKMACIDDDIWNVFCSLRSVWNFCALKGETRSGNKILSRGLASPEKLLEMIAEQ